MSVTAVPLQPVKRAYKVWLWIGVIVAIALAFGLAWIGTREQVAIQGTDEQYLAWNKGRAGVHTTASGLQYEVLRAGEGPTAGEGDYVVLDYEGRLRDGTVFDKNEKIPFPVQPGSAIPGFLEGLKLMQKGGKYRLWIPANLAYGVQSPDPAIPPNSMLVFTVSPQRVLPAAVVQQMMMQRMMQQQQMQQGGGASASPPPGVEGQSDPSVR